MMQWLVAQRPNRYRTPRRRGSQAVLSRLAPGMLWLLAALLSGCRGERVQSALHPAGPAAAQIAVLWWFMFILLTAVFVLVVLLLALALMGRPLEDDRPPLGNKFIVVSGIVLPAILVVVLLVATLETTVALNTSRATADPSANPVTIEVIGHMWWWEVRYPQQGIVTANEIHIPVGQPVRLELRAADVIHSFWVPQLQGKRDMLPDHTNAFWMQADRPGTYRGQCAEYCGVQHARMAFLVVALPQQEFEAWLEQRQQPPPEPETDLLQRGKQVYLKAGCGECHTIRQTPATGLIGPDLTHMGSRLTVGAGQWPNNPGNLAGWIANPQAMKPGNEMPRTYVEPNDLHALVAYLQSLQ